MVERFQIILFAPSIHTGGGTERVLVNLANALYEKGFSVIIAVNDIGDNYLFDLNEDIRIEQYWFGKVRSKYGNILPVKMINKVFGGTILDSFLKKISKKDSSLIISYSNSITIDCYYTSFSDSLIAYEHWPYWITDKHPKLQKKINAIYPELERVIVLTDHEKNVYESIGCNNVKKIYNAYSFFPENPSNLENKIVLSIGHFNSQKRRDLLVKAWKLVHDKNSEWKLVIIGDGPNRKTNKELINSLGLSESIRIVDPTPNIIDYYSKASIFVLSSEFESFSLVLQEAKTFGIPCVSFNVIAGPNEVLNHGKDSFLVPFPDTEKLADKINVLIEDKSLRQKFGMAARKDVKKRFAPERIYSTWEEMLNQNSI